MLRKVLAVRLPKQHQPLLTTLLDNVEKVCCHDNRLAYARRGVCNTPSTLERQQDYKTHQREIYAKLVDILKVLRHA